jgi:hypothetical protein
LIDDTHDHIDIVFSDHHRRLDLEDVAARVAPSAGRTAISLVRCVTT